MNTDQLIKKVTDAVFAELLKTSPSESDLQKVKQKAVIISEMEEPLLEQVLRRNYKIEYFQPNTKNADLVVVPRMTISMLVNLATGYGQTLEEQFIIYSLLNGYKVVAISSGLEHKRYKGRAPTLLFNLYEENVMKLTRFGITFCENVEAICPKKHSFFSEEKKEKDLSINSPIEEDVYVLQKKLVSEADLKKLYVNNQKRIRVASNAIFTPLANDYVRSVNIEIIRE